MNIKNQFWPWVVFAMCVVWPVMIVAEEISPCRNDHRERGIHLLDVTETAETSYEPQNYFIIDSQTYHKMRSDDWLYLQENMWSKRNYHSALCFSLTLEDIIYPPMQWSPNQGGVATYNGVHQHSQQLELRLKKGAEIMSSQMDLGSLSLLRLP